MEVCIFSYPDPKFIILILAIRQSKICSWKNFVGKSKIQTDVIFLTRRLFFLLLFFVCLFFNLQKEKTLKQANQNISLWFVSKQDAFKKMEWCSIYYFFFFLQRWENMLQILKTTWRSLLWVEDNILLNSDMLGLLVCLFAFHFQLADFFLVISGLSPTYLFAYIAELAAKWKTSYSQISV